MVDQPADCTDDGSAEDGFADRPLGLGPPPITPHATPVLDGRGQLTYIGDDGRRYVVGLPPETDEQTVERVMDTLAAGGEVFQRIEGLCHRWIAAVSGPELEVRAALVLLLTTLETALEDTYGES